MALDCDSSAACSGVHLLVSWTLYCEIECKVGVRHNGASLVLLAWILLSIEAFVCFSTDLSRDIAGPFGAAALQWGWYPQALCLTVFAGFVTEARVRFN